MTGKELVENLEKAGYFEYTDKSNLTSVKASIIKHFDNRKEFMTEFSRNPPYQSYDLRFYDTGDGEELFEEGGVISMIEDMRPFLERNHIQLNYSDDKYDTNVHTIAVNGRSYLLAHASPRDWGETFAKFAEMLNAELQIQNSKERLYLMTNENGSMVFLTDEQYKIIVNYIPPDKRPLKTDEWVAKTTDEFNSTMSKVEMYMPDIINSLLATENSNITSPSKNPAPSLQSRRSWLQWLKR